MREKGAGRREEATGTRRAAKISAVTQADPLAEMMTAWKKASDEFMSAWAQTLEQNKGTDEHEKTVQQLRDTYLGTQANLAEARKRFAEPAIEMAGGVPLSEFRRLMDQVQTILGRLDHIDDQLAAIRTGKKPGRKKKKADAES
jgi:predicted  nucleic acid-binding Zn-ribbon protein